VQPAVPLVAAALPHEPDAALALHLLSVRDLLPRPGYVLVARGRQPVPGGTSPATAPGGPPATAPGGGAWRVDLMHCGTVIESYWFTDARRLAFIRAEGPPPILSRRTDPADASRPAEPRPPAAPTTRAAP
jgi:hypothetical protein